MDPALAGGDAGRLKVQLGQLRHTACAVHHQVCVDRVRPSGGVDGHAVAGPRRLDGTDAGLGAGVDADLGAAGDQQIDQVGIEPLQRSGAAVKDGWSAADPGGDVRELERDEPAADEHHSLWQRRESRNSVLSIRCSPPGTSSGRGRAPVATSTCWNAYRAPSTVRWSSAVNVAVVQGVDPVGRQLSLEVVRDRVGEAALVAHQVGPVDRQAPVIDASAAQQPDALDDVRAAAEDLLRITAPQRAGAAVGKDVDDRDPPPRGGALVRRRHPGHTGTDHYEVVGLGHRMIPAVGQWTPGRITR